LIKDGLIQLDNINGVPFRQDLIPVTNKYSRPQNPMIPEYVTIHNTGNSKRDADANMHTEYVDNVTDRYVSWHFTVDDKEIIQELPIIENGWHAGDGRGIGNMKSIGIEICENEGINWTKAKENAVKLIVFLLNSVTTLKLDPIVPHQKWSGKYCPHKILDEGWDKFLTQINQYKNGNKGSDIVVDKSFISKKIITANSLNVRSEPNSSSKDVGDLLKDEIITVTGSIGKWLRVSFNEKDCYIHGDFTQDYVEVDYQTRYKESQEKNDILISKIAQIKKIIN